MRARTRFVLDIALAIGLVAAYRPAWTGISFHQWLSVAIIAPLLVHLVVNWQWALRVLSTFLHRLFSASRLNFVVDCTLLVATVSVMLSGFMVSPAIVSPLGIRPSDPLVWHELHLWSANATIVLFALHAALHWRWFFATAKRLVAPNATRGNARIAPIAEMGASAAVSAMAHAAPSAIAAAPAARRSRVGSRAAQAAAERAAALRVAAVLGVTGALGIAIFVGVGATSPHLASASQPTRVASTGPQVCPTTGCKASRCHGESGESPEVFYGLAPKRATPHAVKPATSHRAARASAAKATARSSASTSDKTSTRTAAHSATVAGKPRVTTTPKPAKPAVVRKRLMICPHTGCSASSCHGAHHQSAASFYH